MIELINLVAGRPWAIRAELAAHASWTLDTDPPGLSTSRTTASTFGSARASRTSETIAAVDRVCDTLPMASTR